MKKLYTVLVLLSLSIAALAQNGRQLYNKYSDLPGVDAIYISPAMFRMIGRIPDVEINDADVNFSSIIKSMTGFYFLETTSPEIGVKMIEEVNRYVSSGNYELLMEAKESGEVTRLYTSGDDKTISSFVMFSQEDDDFAFISFDGKMDREELENLLAEAAKD